MRVNEVSWSEDTEALGGEQQACLGQKGTGGEQRLVWRAVKVSETKRSPVQRREMLEANRISGWRRQKVWESCRSLLRLRQNVKS